MRAKHPGWQIPTLILLISLFSIATRINADEEAINKSSSRRESAVIKRKASAPKATQQKLRLEIPEAALGKPARYLKFSEPLSLHSVRGVKQAAGERGILSVSRHIEVKPDDVALGRCEGQTSVIIKKGNYKLERIEGGYLIPKKSVFFDLPEGVKVTGVQLINARHREMTITDKSQRIRPGPEPARVRIAANKGEKKQPEPAPIKFKKQKKTERFYPDQAVTFNAINGRKKTLVSVQYRPVLFQPSTERLIVITEADIEVSYSR